MKNDNIIEVENIEDPNELIPVIPEDERLKAFTTGKGVDPYLEELKHIVSVFKPDLTTEEGRKDIASFAYQIARFKTRVDEMGKTLKEEYTPIPKKIDAERKRVRELLEGLQKSVRAPLTAWEEAEDARVGTIKSNVSKLRGETIDMQKASTDDLRELLQWIESEEITAETYLEYAPSAIESQAEGVSRLKLEIERRELAEAQEKELAELRADKARIEDEKNQLLLDKNTNEALAKARESLAALDNMAIDDVISLSSRLANYDLSPFRGASSYLDLEAVIEAGRAKVNEAIKRATKPVQPLSSGASRIASPRDKQAEVNRLAAKELINHVGLSEEVAKMVIIAIVEGKIPNVSINYI